MVSRLMASKIDLDEGMRCISKDHNKRLSPIIKIKAPKTTIEAHMF